MNWTRSFSVLAFLTTVPLAASLATPAAAQPYPGEPYYGGIVPPGHVMRTLTGMGLQPASEPRLRGRVWVVRGIGREGTVVRVVLDSHTGRVVDMRAVNRPGMYGPGVQPGPYQPDPRYVMRDPYPPEARAYPAPRPGQVYQDEPPYPGPRGAVAPDDDDDDIAPQPRGYVPHSSVTKPAQPRVSSKPEAKAENRRVAAKPPLPKARPDDIKSGIKADTAKKDDAKTEDVKQDVAKAETNKTETKTEPAKAADSKTEPKKQQASAPLTSPKDPETTASIAAAHKKAEAEARAGKMEASKTEAKKETLPPVQPLE
jgi:hypothetical protein